MLRVLDRRKAGARGMGEIAAVLTRWALDTGRVRERRYRAPTPRERERWHARWLLAQGWSANQVAESLVRDAHTIGPWLATLDRDGPPRPRPGGPEGAEDRGASRAGGGRHCPGQLELEGCASVH